MSAPTPHASTDTSDSESTSTSTSSGAGATGHRFRVLGPFEVHTNGEWTGIGAAKQRTLLTLLVLNGNRVVPSEQLISELWGNNPPGSANRLLAGYVWRLRRLLGDPLGEHLVTRAPGYQLVVGQGAVDIHEYECHVRTGRRRMEAHDLAGAVESYTAALDLWRGSPLLDVPLTPSVMAETARLEESRLSVIEARLGAQVGLGQHEAVLPDLKQIVSQYPLRERLHEHLMLALYRTGQQADSLGTYHDLRHLLVKELGIEPSKPLRDLHQRILQEDPTLLLQAEPAPGPAVRVEGTEPPRLPPEPTFLVGRDEELATLVQRLRAGETLCAVHGSGGVGKTALALRAGHLVADRFPDGQVYLDLGGSSPRSPTTPLDTLHRLLRALGLPDREIPADLDGAAARWHALAATRRILVVVDDVVDADQVRPLLSGSSECAVLVVGRPALAVACGMNQIWLGRLSIAHTGELLHRYAGPNRAGSRAALAAVGRMCDYLPLALRIAAARLARRPDWSVDVLATRLAEPKDRLDLLTFDRFSMRASICAGVRLVRRIGTPAALGTLCVLSELDVPVVSGDALAGLLDSKAEADTVAESLIHAGLVEALDGDRYRVPQLVRLFCQDWPESVLGPYPADSAKEVQRLVAHYTGLLSAQLKLVEHRAIRESTLAWYRQELDLLRVLVGQDPTGRLLDLLTDLRARLTGTPSGSLPEPVRRSA